MSTGLAYKILPKDKGIVITGRGSCEDKNLIIPEEIDGQKVVAIENGAFKYDKLLVSVKIANTISHIGDCAFYECKNLESMVFPEETYIVGSYAFACNHKLKTIVFGRIGQLDWFGQEYFHCCDKIKNIEICRRGYNPKV